MEEHRQLEVPRQAQASAIRVSRSSPESKRATIRSWDMVREILSVKSSDFAVLDAVQQPLGCDTTDIVGATD